MGTNNSFVGALCTMLLVIVMPAMAEKGGKGGNNTSFSTVTAVDFD